MTGRNTGYPERNRLRLTARQRARSSRNLGIKESQVSMRPQEGTVPNSSDCHPNLTEAEQQNYDIDPSKVKEEKDECSSKGTNKRQSEKRND